MKKKLNLRHSQRQKINTTYLKYRRHVSNSKKAPFLNDLSIFEVDAGTSNHSTRIKRNSENKTREMEYRKYQKSVFFAIDIRVQ